MSIVNRYRNLGINSDKIAIENKWTIIFYKPEKFNSYDNDDLLRYLYELTVSTIQEEIIIENVYIYVHENFANKEWFNKTIIKLQKILKPQTKEKSVPNVFLMTIPDAFKSNSAKLLALKNFLDDKKNIIFLEHGVGYIGDYAMNFLLEIPNTTDGNDGLSKINTDQHIYSTFTGYQNLDEIYAPIIQKFRLTDLVETKSMVIPYSEKNHDFINNAFDMATQLKTKDENFATNISITITNVRFGYYVKNIMDQNFGKKFVRIDSKPIYHFLAEIYLSGKNDYVEKEIIPYDNGNYIFYPYLDLDIKKNKMVNNYMDSNANTRLDILSNKSAHDILLPPVFNTNGFSMDIPNDKTIYQLMFKRFENQNSGFFVKKEYGKAVIPKIIHHIWFDEEPNKNYTNMWGRILKEPWQYVVWSDEDIKKYISNNNRWNILFGREKNSTIRKLLVYLSILEKYGGLVIDSYTIPLRIIPDELLTKKFMLGLMNENNSGTKLSFRIMAAVPGRNESTEKKIIAHGDPARRPFEAANNFFRDVKLHKTKKLETNNDDVRFPTMYDAIHNILSQDGDLGKIENLLVSDPNVTILPSYYFNPSIYAFPKKLVNNAVLINLWKSVGNTSSIPTKTEPKRTYRINEKGIIAKLNENPKDRLKNSNKIE